MKKIYINPAITVYGISAHPFLADSETFTVVEGQNGDEAEAKRNGVGRRNDGFGSDEDWGDAWGDE